MSLFVHGAKLAEELAAEGSRLRKRAALAGAIGSVAGERNDAQLRDAGLFALYLAGTPFPESDQRKLNAGGALLSKAVKEVAGATDAELGAAYRWHGDLGAAAFDLLRTQDLGKEPVVTLQEIEAAFAAMAVAATTKIRAEVLNQLLRRSTAIEAKYLLKLMLGDMRIGVKQSLVEEAIAVAAGAEVAAVRNAVMLEADLADATRRAFAGTLAEARMRLFHPLGFMLASPVETPEEAVDRFTEKPRPVKKPAAAERKKADPTAGAAAEELAEGTPGTGDLDATITPSGAADADFRDAPELDLIAAPEPAEAERIAAEGEETQSPGSGADDAVQRAAGLADQLPASSAVQAFLEDKYDGMRAQLHFGDPSQPGRVAIYSRNRDDVTESFPELVEAFALVGSGKVGSGEAGSDEAGGSSPEQGGVILDGEILGWDLAADRALPFAVLGQRIGRKRVPNEVRREIPVVFMAFDLLYADGGLTLDQPLRQRRIRLEELAADLGPVAHSPLVLPETPKTSKPNRGKAAAAASAGQAQIFNDDGRRTEGSASPEPGTTEDGAIAAGGSLQPLVPRLLLSPARLVETAAAIDQAYADARARANEGVMLKAAGSPYLPGRRGLLWVKLKRELATLDVVITGAEFGSGRKSQVLSDYTFAVRGPAGELLNVGKAYSGVTDAEIAELTQWLKAHTLEDFGHFRTVEPERILEVAFNNIMRSDRHASGFALRFPRIVRLRPDKPLAEIDTLERVAEVYESQVDKPSEA